MGQRPRMNDAEYAEFLQKVRDLGHLSHLSERVEFLALTPNHDWLDIKLGEVSVRIDIKNDEIYVLSHAKIDIKRMAMNSVSIKLTQKEVK